MPSVRARRIAIRVLAAGAAVAVVYELAINVFLYTGALARVLSSDPATLAVDYASGWSVWPGRVHATGLRIRSRDSHIEFQLKIDRCVFDAALLDLPRRKFHVTSVQGDGVAFRARRRIEPEQATPRTIEALPPIDDFEPVPLKGPESPPPDDAHYKLITVQLDRVDARAVREIWIDEVHFAGDAHLTGGFYLRPIRWVTVGPALAVVRSGRVTAASDTVASDVAGSLSVTVDGFDPRTTTSEQLLGHLTVRATMNASIPDAAFVNRWAQGSATSGAATVGGGATAAQIDVGIGHGRLVSPSHLDIDTRGLWLDSARGRVEGDGHASAAVLDDAGTDRLDLSVEVRAVRAFEHGFERAPLTVDRAALRLKAAKLDLADHPFSDAALSAQVPAVQIPDARFVNGLLPRGGPLRIEGGKGTCGGRLDISQGVGRGGAVLGLDDVRVNRDSDTISGTVRAHLVLREWNLDQGTIDLAGSRIEVRDVRAGGADGWWASAQLPSSIVTTRPAFAWRARIQAGARDARPLLKLAAGASLPDWVPALFSTDDLHASSDVRVAARSIDVGGMVVTAGPFRVDGSFTKRGDASHALVLVADGMLAVGLEKRDDDTHVQLIAARDWFRQRAASFDTTPTTR